jgi:sugar transferase (PEP-CTERM/EpsH1 system associated)
MEDLLYLTHRIPYPPNKGDKVRSYHFLKHLSERYRVHLGTFVDDEDDWRHVDTVRALCHETRFVRLAPRAAKLKSLRGFLSGQPLTLPYYRDGGMKRWVDDILDRLPVRHILVFSSAMAQYAMQASGARRVADFVDVDSDKWNQYARTRSWPLSAVYRREGRLLLDFEREAARVFDATVFVSAAEAGWFRRLAPESASKIAHVNNGVDFEYFSPDRDYPDPYRQGEKVLVFTGAMDYWPNVDAAEWFAREIFPAIRARLPDTRFYIVGARPTPRVIQLAELPGVSVTGSVPDIRPYLAHAALAVAPLRLARGVQNKVLEAMAMGKTVVASPQAAEGIDAVDGREIRLAGGAAEWADAVCQTLTAFAPEMGAAGRARVVADYGWDSNLAKLDALM